jgi:hypothetical protein
MWDLDKHALKDGALDLFVSEGALSTDPVSVVDILTGASRRETFYVDLCRHRPPDRLHASN